jgi:toxin secretion/phage lysis holin
MKDTSACWLFALIGSVIGFAFGAWNQSLTLLLVCMGVDYISGMAASLREGRGLNSLVGFWGLVRKGLMLLVILVAHRIDELMGGGSAVKMAAIFFYTVNELLSIAENYGRIGLPLPEKVKAFIEILRK